MTIHIIGGGTFSHIRSHLALAVPAFGETARKLNHMFWDTGADDVELHLTKMANSKSSLVTNQDVANLIDTLVADPATRVIIMNAALCDYDGSVITQPDAYMYPVTWKTSPSGKYETRLKTSEGEQRLLLTPADKIIGRIRRTRKDIFAVGFKTTTGAPPDEQYIAGLNLLKANSLNLVLANDTVTRNNMIIAPEETRYHETQDREEVLRGLVEMVMARKDNTFTRSTVVPGDLVDFQNDPRVPDNLRAVVNHLVKRGAYQPFRNSTAGHFAVRLSEGRCLTSRRKVNYTQDGGLDLVEVEYEGIDKVIAHGAKPSVGGQSQRIIFDQHADVDCIAHAHVKLRDNAPDMDAIAMDMGQWSRECGSHDCGKSVSDLIPTRKHLKAVMIDNHGPNIVFNRWMPAEHIIDFIERNFDLTAKTGGGFEETCEPGLVKA